MRPILFFTSVISISFCDEEGMFVREDAIYQRLQQQVVKEGFVTYGNSSYFRYNSRSPGIKIRCNRWNLSLARYQLWLHSHHASWLLRCNVFNTNQTNGADIALRAVQFWRKPIVACYRKLPKLE